MCRYGFSIVVLMEHPPKQGLKRLQKQILFDTKTNVLMEHPPKQGLKHGERFRIIEVEFEF